MAKQLSYKFRISGLVIIILALGIIFRFINLDHKVYWHDEVYTKLHIAGYPFKEWKPALFNGKIHTLEDLQHYQRLTPEKGLNDTLKNLAVDDPHHPPLYYIICRFWVQHFGNSIIAIRSLSVVFSLLAFPAIYWLCVELFSSSTVGWVAVLLFAVSPLFVLYAQEAREYTLWAVLILTSSGALLRAIRITSLRSKSVMAWGIYGIVLTMALYTSLITILVLIVHGIYLLLREQFRLTKIVISYLITGISSLVLFLPWIIVFINNYQQYELANGWMQARIPQLDLFKFLGLNISRIFVDLGGEFEKPLIFIVIVVVISLVVSGLYLVYRRTSVKVWGFIFSLVIIPIAFLLIPDLLGGGVRSVSPRYLIPSWLGILLTLAYLLSTYLTHPRRIWPAIATIIFSAGVISCAVNSQRNTSWMKVISYSLPQVATIINQSNNPLLVGEQFGYHSGNLMALSYLLKPEVKFLLLSTQEDYMTSDTELVSHLNQFKEVFFMSPSDELIEKVDREGQMKIEQVFKDRYLWLGKIKLSPKKEQFF